MRQVLVWCLAVAAASGVVFGQSGRGGGGGGGRMPPPGLGNPARVTPAPAELVSTGGWFVVTPDTPVYSDVHGMDGAIEVARLLAAMYVRDVEVAPLLTDEPRVPAIVFRDDPGVAHPEGYALEITPERITVRASTEAGHFYAAQTLRQLLPPDIERGRSFPSLEWRIRGASIRDEPRFGYRGLMLDPARHFLPTSFVLDTIDVMALHKLNRLHLHLTDDQGWRLAIDAYPELTQIGAWRDASDPKDSNPTGRAHGGFYTKAEIRTIVEHAAAHHIEVIPEIELPGHCGAALATFAHLSCTGKRRGVKTQWGVNREVYCVGKETTFEFLETVLEEVIELFPSEYIHIGGDECPRDRWFDCQHCRARMAQEGMAEVGDLQPYMIGRIARFLAERGRRIIGWDEIAEGELPEGATVMSWRGMRGGIEAANAGFDVIMTPTSHCYFDYAQAPLGEPPSIGQNVLTLETVYGFEPIPDALDEEAAGRILGTQANLWGEWVPNVPHAQYMLYPRLCALAEVAWMPRGARDPKLFEDRMSHMMLRLDALGLRYRDAVVAGRVVGAWSEETVLTDWKPVLWDVTKDIKSAGVYEVAFRFRGGANRLEIDVVDLVVAGNTAGRDQHRGVAAPYARMNRYYLSVPRHEPGMSVKLRAKVRSMGGVDSRGEVWLRKLD